MPKEHDFLNFVAFWDTLENQLKVGTFTLFAKQYYHLSHPIGFTFPFEIPNLQLKHSVGS